MTLRRIIEFAQESSEELDRPNKEKKASKDPASG
jgi:hypothetical protein